MKLALVASAFLSAASLVWAIPTSTTSAAAVEGSQIRTDQDPVYHLYLQNIGGSPVLGPESSAALFDISDTVQLVNGTGSSLYLNVDMTPTTNWKPLTLDATAMTTDWTMSGDTIIASGQQNFVVCPISGSTNYNLYLQTGSNMPDSTCTNWITIHLPCLC